MRVEIANPKKNEILHFGNPSLDCFLTATPYKELRNILFGSVNNCCFHFALLPISCCFKIALTSHFNLPANFYF